jgi:hypothetical protein
MKYIQAQPDRYEKVEDPFQSGIYSRNCFKVKNNYIDARELNIILSDKSFMFIHNNILYFQPSIYKMK